MIDLEEANVKHYPPHPDCSKSRSNGDSRCIKIAILMLRESLSLSHTSSISFCHSTTLQQNRSRKQGSMTDFWRNYSYCTVLKQPHPDCSKSRSNSDSRCIKIAILMLRESLSLTHTSSISFSVIQNNLASILQQNRFRKKGSMTDFWRETILTASSSSFSVNLAEAGIVFLERQDHWLTLKKKKKPFF